MDAIAKSATVRLKPDVESYGETTSDHYPIVSELILESSGTH
jgi:hypothetical protein